MKSLIYFFVCASCTVALDNGLARTPPMGWLSWERFRCNTDCKTEGYNCISEDLIKEMADHMVEEGYLRAGYEYICVDDCWQAQFRDEHNRLQADPERFPNGMKSLIDYVHQKGLKFGIYADFGTETCEGFPGSEFYMKEDAETFAEWGVDLLKFDGCNSDPDQMDQGYPAMQFFLNQTGRPILFSCEWPLYQLLEPPKAPLEGNQTDYAAVARTCNTARNHNDVQDSWSSVSDIINYYGADKWDFSSYAGPGFWNDPDMLIIGDFGLSFTQERVQMAMWAMFAAPLMISADLRSMREEAKFLLQNPLIIALNKDPLGKQAKRIFNEGNIQIWTKPITPVGSFAVAVLNMGTDGTAKRLKITLSDIGLTNQRGYNATELTYGVSYGIFAPHDYFDVYADPSGLVMITALLLPPRK